VSLIDELQGDPIPNPHRIGTGLAAVFWTLAELGGVRPATRPPLRELSTQYIRGQQGQLSEVVRSIGVAASRIPEEKREAFIDFALQARGIPEDARDRAHHDILTQIRRRNRSIDRALPATGTD